jgi:hypothetical protein
MKSKQFFLILIFCFGVTINVFSQTKEISRENFYQPLRQGLIKGMAFSRRVISRRENYREKKVFRTTEITEEYLLPDKRHYLKEERFADRTSKSELIQIGKNYYCRKNDGEWKQFTSWCSGGDGSGGLSNIVSSKFTVEDTKVGYKPVRFYKEYTVYKNVYSPNKDKEGLSYCYSSYWINSEGLVSHKEERCGLSESKKPNFQMTITYEYNPQNLKIETPINQN